MIVINFTLMLVLTRHGSELQVKVIKFFYDPELKLDFIGGESVAA